MGRGWSSGRRGHIGYEEARRGGVTEAPEREGEGSEESCRKGKVWKMAISRGQNLENCQLRGHGSKDIFTDSGNRNQTAAS